MTADGLFQPTSIPGHLAPTPERLERLLSKQTLEELYEVEEQPFARGKYATVRRCRERASGRQWAAKFLRKRRRAQELRAEALHEVAVLDAAAHCSRLVSLHQVFETNSEMVLVLELAPGGELQMILDRDEVPEERQVARLLKQILDGIAFLHSLNVAHLDIKPQNLVLTGDFPDCDVKLCDFGISRYISHGADIREILGTPDYVAPEVLNYEPISLATDMWSVGVLLYVLLTGCSPFGGDTKQETFCNISRCRLDFPDDLFEDVSEEARDLMRKLMVKDPSERLTVTECLQHSWFTMFDGPMASLALSSRSPAEDSSRIESSSTGVTQTSTTTSTTSSMKTTTLQNDQTSSSASSSSSSSSSSKISSNGESTMTATTTSTTPNSTMTPKHEKETSHQRSTSSATTTTITNGCLTSETKSIVGSRAVSAHTENIYTKACKTSPKAIRLGLSPDRRDTFKRNMDSLAQKFSSTEIVIIETTASTGCSVSSSSSNSSSSSSSSNVSSNTSVSAVICNGTSGSCSASSPSPNTTNNTTTTTSSNSNSNNVVNSATTIIGTSQRRATATHTMPAGDVFKCTPVFILGEEQQCSDGGSDTISEISTDSSSDRSSIYSDDSLDFILYGKSQGRASFPFATTDSSSDRWGGAEHQRHHHHHHPHHQHPRAWPRECNGVVSKALSRFTSETSGGVMSVGGCVGKTSSVKGASTPPVVVRGKTGLEALRERGGNLVVIREPVRAGRYTRYSEVQCESVQARIRRFQVHGAS